MWTYIARRCLQTAVILAGLTVFLFTLFRIEAFAQCRDHLATPTTFSVDYYQGCVAQFGLDLPLPAQYGHWLSGALHGDFGVDWSGAPVLQAIMVRVPRTVILVGFSFLLQELIGLPLGILAALKRFRPLDWCLTVFSYLGLSLPAFWLSLFFIFIFAVKLAWLPPGGIVSALSPNPIVGAIPEVGGPGYWSYLLAHPVPVFGDLLNHLILPALTLAFAGIAADSRLMRITLLKELASDYARTARAKGLPRSTVLLKHTMRNALLPMITNGALLIPTLFSGAAVVETIFSWQGVGQYFINELRHRDYNALVVILLFVGLLTLLANLAADLLYGIADPRIQYE